MMESAQKRGGRRQIRAYSRSETHRKVSMTIDRKTAVFSGHPTGRGRVVSAILLAGCLLASAPAALGWTTVGPGIEYQEFTLPDPNNLFVARMDRRNPAVIIDSSIGQGRLSGGTETVRNQASRYEDAIGFWGTDWGRRNDVIVAINGDFYNTSTGVPTGGQIHSGWFAKQFSGAAFGWTLDRNAFISSNSQTLRVRYLASGAAQDCNGINRTRGTNELILFTPQYDSTTKTDTTGVEVLVEMARPAMEVGTVDPTRGWIRQIRNNLGSTPIPFDHVVLSATGTAATTLLNNAAVDAEVAISTPGNNPAPWTRAYAGVGAGEQFLANGIVVGGQDVLHPRTAIAYNSNYVFFVVVDGRKSSSIGMTMAMLGNFCKDYLGATWGINQDGGGSSTMVVNGVVKNDPSDGSERAVSNGMMMVAVQPKIHSTAYGANATVKTTATANVRLGPGTNYAVLTSVARNAQGTVLDHSLGGVFAKGYYWWKCDFSGTPGWLAESNLSLVSPGGYPSFSQHPVDQNPCLNDTVVLSVQAGGSGSLAYQWQKDGINLSDGGRLSGAATTTLTISSFTSGDAASYRCRVTDSIGTTTSHSAALFPPRALTVITQHPQSLDSPPVPHGETVGFSTSATGDGTISYQWQFDGNDLAEGARHIGVATASLTILHVTGDDSGAYRCRITAGCGTGYTNPAQLTVNTPDFDGDGDVDAVDFGHLQTCLSGRLVPVSDPACMNARMDRDADVDYDDVLRLLGCLSGPDQPYDHDCLN